MHFLIYVKHLLESKLNTNCKIYKSFCKLLIMIKLLKQSLKMKLKELIKILKLNKEVILNSLKIKKAHG